MAALDGLRILDLTQYESGTSCTQALAWLGAEVIKVERPGEGDPGRRAFDPYGFEDSEYFLNWNCNKRSVVLDLEQPEGRELLLRMAPAYDVFVENFAPGVVEKLDLGYDVLSRAHPPIIYGSIKGFGTSGPYARYKCFDPVAQAAGGALSVTGEADGPPMRPGITVGDSGSGVQMALALLAAYIQRLRTGEGQLVELSMQEAVTYYLRTTIALGSSFGERAAPRQGNGFGALTDLYPCRPFGANDYVYIMALTPRMWKSLCRAMERSDLLTDERFDSPEKRRDHGEHLKAEIAAWTARHTKQDAMRRLAEEGVPASAVLDTRDLFADPHLEERGFIQRLEHPERGEILLLGWPPRLSKSEVPIEPPPTLGQDTEEILEHDLGLSGEAIAALRAKRVVGDS